MGSKQPQLVIVGRVGRKRQSGRTTAQLMRAVNYAAVYNIRVEYLVLWGSQPVFSAMLRDLPMVVDTRVSPSGEVEVVAYSRDRIRRALCSDQRIWFMVDHHTWDNLPIEDRRLIRDASHELRERITRG